MDRNEAKTLMRQQLERDVDNETREKKLIPVGKRLLSANELMDEVDQETNLGKMLLDDFIAYQNGTETELAGTERAHAIAMMEEDIQSAPPEWKDEVIYSIGEKKFTPSQVLDEVKRGTEFGNRFAVAYLDNHTALESLLGKGYDDKLSTSAYDLPPIYTKVTNDKAN